MDNGQQNQTPSQSGTEQSAQTVEVPIRIETAENSRMNKGDESGPISTKDRE